MWEKVQEELAEFQAEVEKGSSADREAEFGDLLFSMINYARFLKINPDTALERTNQKFTQRFNYLEAKAQKPGEIPARHDPGRNGCLLGRSEKAVITLLFTFIAT